MCVKLLVFVKLHVYFLQKDSDIVLVLGILLQLFHGRELRQFCLLFLWSNMQCWFGNYVSFNYRNFMVGKRLVIRFLLLPIQKKRKKKKVVLLEKIWIWFFIAIYICTWWVLNTWSHPSPYSYKGEDVPFLWNPTFAEPINPMS